MVRFQFYLQQFLYRMSTISPPDPQRYLYPEIQPRPETKYSFNQLKNLRLSSKINESAMISSLGISTSDYPVSGQHSRFPIVINCENCQQLTLTEVEYERGWASFLWCLVLTPFLGTGCCCFCMNSCKDVKHKCSKCRMSTGVCESRCL